MKIECVVKTESIIGESPVWSAKDRLLYWVDIAGKILHRWNPATKEHKSIQFAEKVSAVALGKGASLILTLGKKVVRYDSKTTVLAEIESNVPDNRFNDAKCDRQGRLWVGTINGVHWKNPDGVLYCVHANGKVAAVEKGAICLNGIGWSPDDKTMYVVQSFRYAIYAYDFDPARGTLSRKREFARIPEQGFPDGLKVDAEGFVWCAHTGSGKVVRYGPNGKVDREIVFPVPRTTSCIFGGDNLDTLYVTSARETMTPEQLEKYPLSGALFSCKPQVKGLPEPIFGEHP